MTDNNWQQNNTQQMQVTDCQQRPPTTDDNHWPLMKTTDHQWRLLTTDNNQRPTKTTNHQGRPLTTDKDHLQLTTMVTDHWWRPLMTNNWRPRWRQLMLASVGSCVIPDMAILPVVGVYAPPCFDKTDGWCSLSSSKALLIVLPRSWYAILSRLSYSGNLCSGWSQLFADNTFFRPQQRPQLMMIMMTNDWPTMTNDKQQWPTTNDYNHNPLPSLMTDNNRWRWLMIDATMTNHCHWQPTTPPPLLPLGLPLASQVALRVQGDPWQRSVRRWCPSRHVPTCGCWAVMGQGIMVRMKFSWRLFGQHADQQWPWTTVINHRWGWR